MNLKPIKTILYVCATLCIQGCIEEYKPLIEVSNNDVFVISGMVTDEEGYHEIEVSLASDIYNPVFIPVNGCDIQILDNEGNIFYSEDMDNGNYRVWIDQEYLKPGKSYKINVTTPQGLEITSDYEKMPDGADIDSIYYLIENKPTTDPEEPIMGIRFYTDMDGANNNSRYYRYTIEETWEYHSLYPNYGYYTGSLVSIDPPDYSRFICWKTQMVPEIFVLSTMHLSNNSYLKFPLHYIKNTSEKLAHGYSLLLSQYALSEGAYFYWTKIKNNTMEEGGLYNTQPELIKGNLYNITNSDTKVLGYFTASSVSSKRIFIKEVTNLELDYPTRCVSHELRSGADGTIFYPPQRPVYLLLSNGYPVSWLNDNCVDCTSRGGTTVKPDFWPN